MVRFQPIANKIKHFFKENDHVSDGNLCEHCKKLERPPTPHLSGQSLFGGTRKKLTCSLKLSGDGKDITRNVGVVPDYCPWCEIAYFGEESRGAEHSTQTSSSEVIFHTCSGEKVKSLSTIPRRTLKKRKDIGSKNMVEVGELAKTLKKKPTRSQLYPIRKKHLRYSEKPVLEIDTVLVGEFHTVIRRAGQLYKRFTHLCQQGDQLLKVKSADCVEYNHFYSTLENLQAELSERQSKSLSTKKKQAELKRVRNDFKNCVGPRVNALSNALSHHKIKMWSGHGGSFLGDSAYELLKSEEIPEVLNRSEYRKRNSQEIVSVGSSKVCGFFITLAKHQQKELKITSHNRSFCIHMVKNLEILMGELGREKHKGFPLNYVLLSDHFRTHLLELVKTHGDLKGSERGTELMNQRMIAVSQQVKGIPDAAARAKKTVEILQIKRDAGPTPIGKIYSKRSI